VNEALHLKTTLTNKEKYMKTLSTISKAVFLSGMIIASSVSADDKNIPELLVGVSDAQVEALSTNESAETRGERIRIPVGAKPGWCGWKPCLKTVYGTITVKVRRNGSTYYVKH